MPRIKERMLKNIARQMGYDVDNPVSIMKKTIIDTVKTSRAFMSKSEITIFLEKVIVMVNNDEF